MCKHSGDTTSPATEATHVKKLCTLLPEAEPLVAISSSTSITVISHQEHHNHQSNQLTTMADLIVAIKENRFTDVTRRLTQESKPNLKVLVNYQDRESHESLLFCACIKGHLRLAKFLLDRGARSDLRTCWGAAPIHAASEKGHEELIRLLLRYGSGVNWQTQYGDTPLHLAAYRGHYEVVKFLVETGCDIGVINSKGKTAVDEANNGGNKRIVQYLMLLMASENILPPRHRLESKPDAMCTRVLEPPSTWHQQDTTTSSIKITTWHHQGNGVTGGAGGHHGTASSSSSNELKRHHQTFESSGSISSTRSSSDMLRNDLSSEFKSGEKCRKREMYKNVKHSTTTQQMPDQDARNNTRDDNYTVNDRPTQFNRSQQSHHSRSHPHPAAQFNDIRSPPSRRRPSNPEHDTVHAAAIAAAEQRKQVCPENKRIMCLEKAVTDLQQGLVMTQEELAKTKTELQETQVLLHRLQLWV